MALVPPAVTGKRPKYPPIVLLIVDAAGAVWALPEQHLPDTPARIIGEVRAVNRVTYAWETVWNGRSSQVWSTPREAAQGLIDELNKRHLPRQADAA